MQKPHHQNIVYFLHAANEDFCKIGKSTMAGLAKRKQDYEKSKTSRVTVIGYKFCNNEKAAGILEKKLLNKFDRIGDQELVMIDPELVDYIRKKCSYSDKPYLDYLLPIPDYDDFDEAEKQKVKAYADKVHLARKSHEQTKRRLEDAKKSEKEARQMCLEVQQKQDNYLVELAMTLREQGWKIKKIAEFIGQSENQVKNSVHKRNQSTLF